MPARQMTDTPLSPELDAIATAAADRLRAAADANTTSHDELRRRVAEAASAAIGAGAALGAIADAERVGQARARGELGLMPSNGSRVPLVAGAKPTQSTSRRSSAPRGSD
jgi:hypothetical protein